MPAVFVHGVPDTYHLWDPLRSDLRRSEVVAVSLPGFDTPVPDGFSASKGSVRRLARPLPARLASSRPRSQPVSHRR